MIITTIPKRYKGNSTKAKSLFLNKVIITEKDAVKIGDFSLAFNCGVDFYVLPIEMTFALKDEEILRKHWEDLL